MNENLINNGVVCIITYPHNDFLKDFKTKIELVSLFYKPLNDQIKIDITNLLTLYIYYFQSNYLFYKYNYNSDKRKKYLTKLFENVEYKKLKLSYYDIEKTDTSLIFVFNLLYLLNCYLYDEKFKIINDIKELNYAIYKNDWILKTEILKSFFNSNNNNIISNSINKYKPKLNRNIPIIEVINIFDYFTKLNERYQLFTKCKNIIPTYLCCDGEITDIENKYEFDIIKNKYGTKLNYINIFENIGVPNVIKNIVMNLFKDKYRIILDDDDITFGYDSWNDCFNDCIQNYGDEFRLNLLALKDIHEILKTEEYEIKNDIISNLNLLNFNELMKINNINKYINLNKYLKYIKDKFKNLSNNNYDKWNNEFLNGKLLMCKKYDLGWGNIKYNLTYKYSFINKEDRNNKIDKLGIKSIIEFKEIDGQLTLVGNKNYYIPRYTRAFHHFILLPYNVLNFERMDIAKGEDATFQYFNPINRISSDENNYVINSFESNYCCYGWTLPSTEEIKNNLKFSNLLGGSNIILTKPTIDFYQMCVREFGYKSYISKLDLNDKNKIGVIDSILSVYINKANEKIYYGHNQIDYRYNNIFNAFKINLNLSNSEIINHLNKLFKKTYLMFECIIKESIYKGIIYECKKKLNNDCCTLTVNEEYVEKYVKSLNDKIMNIINSENKDVIKEFENSIYISSYLNKNKIISFLHSYIKLLYIVVHDIIDENSYSYIDKYYQIICKSYLNCKKIIEKNEKNNIIEEIKFNKNEFSFIHPVFTPKINSRFDLFDGGSTINLNEYDEAILYIYLKLLK